MQEQHNNITNGFLSIIGIGVDPNSTEPDFYVLAVDDDSAITRPITHEGYIVIFTKIGEAPLVLLLAPPNIIELGPAPNEEILLIDAIQVLYLLEAQDVDDKAVLLNFINVTMDFIEAIHYTIPIEYQKILIDFANHLTIEKEFASFFATHDVNREKMKNAITWLIGAIASNVTVFDEKLLAVAQ